VYEVADFVKVARQRVPHLLQHHEDIFLLWLAIYQYDCEKALNALVKGRRLLGHPRMIADLEKRFDKVFRSI
jgi:hypothetical protein